MPTSDRYLHFNNLDTLQPDIQAQCSVCGREFNSKVRFGERVDDVLFRIRAAYNSHTCEAIR